MEVKWILCPICGNKTQTMIREDTELRKACFIEACVDIGKDFLPKFVSSIYHDICAQIGNGLCIGPEEKSGRINCPKAFLTAYQKCFLSIS